MTAGRRPGRKRSLTDADLVTLGVLSRGPAHGHAIWSGLAAHDVEDWAAVSRAQVYYSLGKLADQGLIRAAQETKADTRRERRRNPRIQKRQTENRSYRPPKWQEQRALRSLGSAVGVRGSHLGRVFDRQLHLDAVTLDQVRLR